MKKIICVLLLLSVLLAAFASCSGEKNEESETEAAGDPGSGSEETQAPSSSAKKDFVPETLTPDAAVLRQYQYDHMVKMSSIEWTTPKKIDLSEIQEKLGYEPGVTYTGMPYTFTNKQYEQFLSRLDENNVYQGPYDKPNAVGNTCSSSIVSCWMRISSEAVLVNTVKMTPAVTSWIAPVGSYNYVEKEDDATEKIIARNSRDDMLEAYAQLQFGDVIVASGGERWGNTGHARMIKEVHVERTAGGKVKPNSSYVVCIEQTNAFDRTRTDGVKTTWYIEHQYNFADLYSVFYVPVTLKMYTEELPEFKAEVNGFNSAKTITKGNLIGTISSTYYIETVDLEFLDGDGNVVTGTSYDCYDYKFAFNNRTAPEGLSSLEKGEYLCRITIHTPLGAAAIHGFYFTVK